MSAPIMYLTYLTPHTCFLSAGQPGALRDDSKKQEEAGLSVLSVGFPILLGFSARLEQ